MTTFDPDTFEMKYQIADAASDLYVTGDGEFLIRDVAEKVGLDPGEIFNYFPDKKTILQFYYFSLNVRYESMVDDIEDFDSYTISEKLSSFIYASFDMLQEKEEFVQHTFEDFILKRCNKTPYEKEIEELFQRFLENDERKSISSTVLMHEYGYSFLRRQYLELVRFWIQDTSEGKELSMELTDKLTGLLQEVLYDAVLDKGLDLVRFMANNRKEFLKNIPVVKHIASKIEIR